MPDTRSVLSQARSTWPRSLGVQAKDCLKYEVRVDHLSDAESRISGEGLAGDDTHEKADLANLKAAIIKSVPIPEVDWSPTVPRKGIHIDEKGPRARLG